MSNTEYEAIWPGMYADPDWIMVRGRTRAFAVPVRSEELDRMSQMHGRPIEVERGDDPMSLRVTYGPEKTLGALTSGRITASMKVDAPDIPGPREAVGRRERRVSRIRVSTDDLVDVWIIGSTPIEHGDALPKIRAAVARGLRSLVPDWTGKDGWRQANEALARVEEQATDYLRASTIRIRGLTTQWPYPVTMMKAVLSPTHALLGNYYQDYGDVEDDWVRDDADGTGTNKSHSGGLWMLIASCALRALSKVVPDAPCYIDLLTGPLDLDTTPAYRVVDIRPVRVALPGRVDEALDGLDETERADVLACVERQCRSGRRCMMLVARAAVSDARKLVAKG